MIRTKETHVHKKAKNFLRRCTFIVPVFLIGLLYAGTYKANAALLSVHNYVTDDTYNYSRAQVNYMVNGEKVATDYPGLILSNGAAVGPYQEIFEDSLGASSDYTDGKKSFTIAYGQHTIKMTLGNTEAVVNGVKKTMSNAPFVYSFNDSSEKYLYVPTRFVAETLGFEYTWNSTSSTVTIVRPNVIYDGKEPVKYSDGNPVFSLNGNAIVSPEFPGYILENTVFFSAEDYFKNTGMASYAYAEGSGLIAFQKGDCMVRLVLDSPVAYINETPYLLDAVPRLLTPYNSKNARVYVPAQFVAEALGYTVSYRKDSGAFRVTGELPKEDNSTAKVPVLPGSSVVPDTASYGEVLFSYETHEQLFTHFTELGYQVPNAISAYSCLHSDALYLKGIDTEQVRITDKDDVFEVEISGVHNPFDGTTCYHPDAAFLNYCYFNGTKTLKIIIIKTKELHYYAYSAPDGCVIHFTDTLGMYEDYLDFVVTSDAADDSDTSSDTTDIFAGSNMDSYVPDAVFSREHFVIRLPEGIEQSSITDTDVYDKKRFTISIPGNHMTFLTEQETYNPVKTLKNVQFNYKAADDTTVLTFNTTKIQGYALTVAGGYLAVRIADPPEIYDKIIVLDAGHGGIDPGTLRGKVYEKDINFNVVNVYAPEYFKDSDIKVYHTRTTDTKIALQTRADFAATVGADLFISFHVNANANASANGTSAYYSASNNKTTATGLKSSLIATSIVNHLSSAWNTRNRGILTERFVVIHNNTVPAVLVECGYITNNSDFEKIKDTAYQKKAAKALYDAVTEIFDKYPTNR